MNGLSQWHVMVIIVEKRGLSIKYTLVLID